MRGRTRSSPRSSIRSVLSSSGVPSKSASSTASDEDDTSGRPMRAGSAERNLFMSFSNSKFATTKQLSNHGGGRRVPLSYGSPVRDIVPVGSVSASVLSDYDNHGPLGFSSLSGLTGLIPPAPRLRFHADASSVR